MAQDGDDDGAGLREAAKLIDEFIIVSSKHYEKEVEKRGCTGTDPGRPGFTAVSN